MPEGPSIVLAKEAIQFFVGKKIIEANGSSKQVDFGRLLGTKITAFKTWGKHLLICFSGFTLRIHFLMFGSYSINESKNGRVPRLHLKFAGKTFLNFYTCAIITIEGPLSRAYDWSSDVLSKRWDPKKALSKLKAEPDEMICDVLLDQQIFSGVGNIIKNEVLFRTKVHPASIVANIPLAKRREIVGEVVIYSREFLAWKREFTLKKHWKAYAKKKCPRDGNDLRKEYLGKTRRRTFYCSVCQRLY